MARVLRVPDHDGDSFVLLYVNNNSNDSSYSLDVTIQGTDNAAPYNLTLERSRISSLKARNSPCSQNEWISILEFVLLGKTPNEAHGDLFAGVEAVASVKTEQFIDITIRNRTEGITQRLGSFQLAFAEGLEIDLFDWCGVAVQATTAAQEDFSTLNARYEEQGKAINMLKTQLDELVASKATHERELLEKFRDLLNQKKSKIRDQQRLLTAARIDPPKSPDAQISRNGKKATKAGSSRPGKRKARVNDELESGEDEDPAREKIDADMDEALSDLDQDAMETPDEDETADEDSRADIPPPKPAMRNTQQVPAAKGKGKSKIGARNDAAVSDKKTSAKEELPQTPPRRNLPFAKKSTTASNAPVVDDDETASEDDEL